MIHRPSTTQGYAVCDRCMKHSAILLAANDVAIAEILRAAGWSFNDRGLSHCSRCADTPATMPARVVRKRR